MENIAGKKPNKEYSSTLNAILESNELYETTSLCIERNQKHYDFTLDYGTTTYTVDILFWISFF